MPDMDDLALRLLPSGRHPHQPGFSADPLFLDEATSSLDANNEKRIVHHLSSFCQGRTVIIAAHRLSTIRHADLIAFFEKGKLIEMGPHDELIQKKGKFYGLVCSQMG